jgi:hypothetical protein
MEAEENKNETTPASNEKKPAAKETSKQKP